MSAPRGPSRRRACAVLAAIVAVSGLVKLAVLAPNAGLDPHADEIQYLFLADDIARGRGLTSSLRPPVYPYVLGAALALRPAGTSQRVATSLAQIAISCVTLVFVYLLAAAAFDRRTGLVAAGILGLYPNAVASTHLLWSETVLLLPLTAALFALVCAWRDGRLPTAAAGGALLGVSALTREFVLWFAPVAAAWLALAPGPPGPGGARASAAPADGRRRRLGLGAACLGATLLCVAPWTIRNACVLGAFVPISTNTATPLFLDNNDVLPRGDPANLVRFYDAFEGRDVERERYARRHALRFILERQPEWILHRLRAGVPNLLRADSLWIRHARSGWYGEVSPGWVRAAAIATTAAYALLLAATALGAAATRFTPARVLLALFAVYAIAIVMPFPIVARYRLPILAGAVPFAAAWLARSPATAGLARRPRALLLGGAAAVILCAIALWDLDRIYSSLPR